MLLLNDVRRSTGTGQDAPVYITHSHEREDGRPDRHVIRVYKPEPAAGEFAATLLETLTLDARQAAELKAHL